MSWRGVTTSVLVVSGVILILLGANTRLAAQESLRSPAPASAVAGVMALSAAVGVLAFGQHRVGRRPGGAGQTRHREPR